MAIEWLAGNRLRGTTAERPALGLPSGSVGGWVELGRTTLSASTSGDIVVSGLADKRYYMVLMDQQASGVVRPNIRLNTDTGSNYSYRYSGNGAADSTGTSTTLAEISNNESNNLPQFSIAYLSNLSSKEKLGISHTMYGGSGAGTAPQRTETVFKHAQTSNPISSFSLYNDKAGDWNTDSEVVVLGWDPDDTHTTNFWEELASVELSSAGDNLGSGTFTAKKYLWIQVFLKASGTYNTRFRVNSDSGSNYAVRWNANGGSDNPDTSQSAFYPIVDGATTNITTNSFMNMFIMNNTSNEKLIMWNGTVQNTAGAGNAPSRSEQVHKWANTSSQITSMQLVTGSGNFTGGRIKVWGAN